MLSVNRDNFTSLFPICMPFFFFFYLPDCSCQEFHYCAKWEWQGWTSLPCSWSSKERFQFLIIEYDGSGLFIYGLPYVEIISFLSQFVECFYLERVLNFIKWFSASTEMITWLSSFIMLMWYTLHWLSYVDPSLYS